MPFISTHFKATFLLLLCLNAQTAVAQKFTDSLLVRENRIWLADTVIARFTRWDNLTDTKEHNSRKELAVVFEQKQYLLRHGLQAEAQLLNNYPLTEWQLLSFYRNNTGKIIQTASFDSMLIRRSELRQKSKILAGTALIFTGLFGISARYISQPTPQTYSQALGQGIGREVLPILGFVSLTSGVVLLVNGLNF
jgi:hypothetical protein